MSLLSDPIFGVKELVGFPGKCLLVFKPLNELSYVSYLI